MSIPIQNIYYLLCYAWNKLEALDEVPVTQDDPHALQNLLARVLTNSTRHLLLRGLDRNYKTEQGLLPQIKGKVQVGPSLRRPHLPQGRAWCSYDSFSHDMSHNQVLKSTLARLLRLPGLDPALRPGLSKLYRRFHGISEIALDKRSFASLPLHRNNRHYHFPIKVCDLLYQSTLPGERPGTYLFRDFRRDEKAMAALFEEFVRGFYQIHLREQFDQIGRETIAWQVSEADEATRRHLPRMETDVTLRSASRKIILDTKYYQSAVSGIRGHFHSTNLYQLYAYLKNQERPDDSITMHCEGILLYPRTGSALNERFVMDGHPVRVCTIDLGQDWKGIEAGLLGVVE